MKSPVYLKTIRGIDIFLMDIENEREQCMSEGAALRMGNRVFCIVALGVLLTFKYPDFPEFQRQSLKTSGR